MSNLLRISDAASFAMHTMAFLAEGPDGWVSTQRIADALGVSENHLSKVCQRLVKVGLLRAIRGPKGGVRLAREPGDIRLIEVFEAIEGTLAPSSCLLGRESCARRECILGSLADNVNKEVVDVLTHTTLAQMKN